MRREGTEWLRMVNRNILYLTSQWDDTQRHQQYNPLWIVLDHLAGERRSSPWHCQLSWRPDVHESSHHHPHWPLNSCMIPWRYPEKKEEEKGGKGNVKESVKLGGNNFINWKQLTSSLPLCLSMSSLDGFIAITCAARQIISKLCSIVVSRNWREMKWKRRLIFQS